MFSYKGKILPTNAPFEIEGTWYPENWLQLTSLEEKLAVGIIQVAIKPPPPPYDSQYYDMPDVPKPLDTTYEGGIAVRRGLKPQWVDEFKSLTKHYLENTDWVVIRKLERGVDIPDNIATYRAAIIAESDRLVAAIEAATTVDEVKAVVSSQQWPAYN